MFSPSPTLVWKLVKISRPLQGQQDSPRSGRHAWRRLGPYGRRKALNVRLVRLSGGASYMQVTARGVTSYVSMDCSIYELWRAVTGCV